MAPSASAAPLKPGLICAVMTLQTQAASSLFSKELRWASLGVAFAVFVLHELLEMQPKVLSRLCLSQVCQETSGEDVPLP